VRIFVLGGTGAIGGHAVPALVAAGHRVTALARSAGKAAALRERGAEPVEASIFDRDGLARVFGGHDAVVNLATAMPTTSRFMLRSAHEANRKVRIQGSAAVAGAAVDAGVPRLVQESVSMVYADGGDRWLDEAAPVDPYWLAESNLAAEASARRFAAAGRRATVLRFGWFYGPGAAHAEEMLAFARRHVVAQLGPAGSYVSSIHLADAATAVVAALDAPAEVYNVVDDEPLTWAQYATALAGAAETRPSVRFPGRGALLLGDRLTSLSRSLRVANRRLRADTRWSPTYPSAREGWKAMASGAP
jgi:nucleoside-diphosphate-sugar epimerase